MLFSTELRGRGPGANPTPVAMECSEVVGGSFEALRAPEAVLGQR